MAWIRRAGSAVHDVEAGMCFVPDVCEQARCDQWGALDEPREAEKQRGLMETGTPTLERRWAGLARKKKLTEETPAGASHGRRCREARAGVFSRPLQPS
eukprot:3280708-Pyramimonas_sp.AAC.1